MGFTKLFILIFFNPFHFCNNDTTKYIAPDELSLSIHQYPMKQITEYIIDYKSIKVRFTNRNQGFDSVIIKKTVRSGHLKKLFGYMNSFEKERYYNQCIEDGQIMTLLFTNKTVVLKKVRFSNYYDKHLEQIIKFINQHVGSKYSILYDKNKLISDFENCKNQ